MINNPILRILAVSVIVLIMACTKEKVVSDIPKSIEEIEIPRLKMMKFGIDFAKYNVSEKKIKKGQKLATLFNSYDTSVDKKEVVDSLLNYIEPHSLKRNNDYFILTDRDNSKKIDYFIYKKNPVEYIIADFKDNIKIRKYKKPVVVKETRIGGGITGSLSKTLSKNGLGKDVSSELSSIYKWTINFFKLRREDKFAMIYDEQFIDDSVSIGIDHLKAVKFEHKGKDFYAFAMENDEGTIEYFNEKGSELKAMFLKAPLKYFRISSKYNLKRYHPVQKKVKPHLGTDFAAPHGTPILATANGKITRKGYGSGNGNFIKIKHNGTYSTQYLHMSRFRKGLKVGSYVSQGDVIGYVGSTGLATGPHVCYRFWKNDKQVDPLKLKLPNNTPLSKREKEIFLKEIAPLKLKLDSEVSQKK